MEVYQEILNPAEVNQQINEIDAQNQHFNVGFAMIMAPEGDLVWIKRAREAEATRL